MKKILLTLVALALMAGMSSCTKEREGKYNPKEKIKTVYNEREAYNGDLLVSRENKFVSEEWTWTDDRLDKILYYDQYSYQSEDEPDSVMVEYDFLYAQFFTYDEDDRLVQSEIEGSGINLKTTCEYEGKYLKILTMKEDDQMLVSYQFNRDGDKISSFDMTLNDDYFEFDEKKVCMLERGSLLHFVMAPEQASKVSAASLNCAKRAAKSGTKDGLVLHFNVEWNDGNVSKISCSYMGSSLELVYSYDNMNNPFYNLFDALHLDNGNGDLMPFASLSKNNVTNTTSTYIEDGERLTETGEYSYTYNKKDFPISKTETDVSDDYRHVEKYYYEYK